MEFVMVNLVFCFRDYREKGWQIAAHSHDCCELVFYGSATRGETEIDGKCFSLGPYSVSLIRRNTPHSERHMQRAEVLFFGFDGPVSLTDGVWNDMKEVGPLFYDIAEEMKNQKWGYENIISLKIQEILICLERKSRSESSTVKNLDYCKRYIEENYMQDVQVSDLAQMTCYSTDRFRHLFEEKFDVYPQRYLISVRLDHAMRLLAATDLKCTEIAMRCGFSDSGQLTKMIKKKYGAAPKKLRSILREEKREISGNKGAEMEDV